MERAHLQKQEDVVAHPGLHLRLRAAFPEGACRQGTAQSPARIRPARSLKGPTPWGPLGTLGNVENGPGHPESLLPGSDFQAIQEPHGVGPVLVGVQLGPLLIGHCRARGQSHLRPDSLTMTRHQLSHQMQACLGTELREPVTLPTGLRSPRCPRNLTFQTETMLFCCNFNHIKFLFFLRLTI